MTISEQLRKLADEMDKSEAVKGVVIAIYGEQTAIIQVDKWFDESGGDRRVLCDEVSAFAKMVHSESARRDILN